jgi:hypothetical protein
VVCLQSQETLMKERSPAQPFEGRIDVVFEHWMIVSGSGRKDAEETRLEGASNDGPTTSRDARASASPRRRETLYALAPERGPAEADSARK